jgi:hypothetical protein
VITSAKTIDSPRIGGGAAMTCPGGGRLVGTLSGNGDNISPGQSTRADRGGIDSSTDHA